MNLMLRAIHPILPALALMAACLFPTPYSAALAAPENAEHEARMDLARNMANTVLSIIQDQNQPVENRKELLIRGFANVVDIDWIAKFVLGNAWRTATDEQRAQYTELYRSYLLQLYVDTYTQQADRKITDMKVLGIKDGEEDRFTTSTEIMMSTGERMKVDYLAAGSGGKYKVIDVVIEGVSLLATHRSEFSKVASSRGVDAVIGKLARLLDPNQPFAISMK